MVNPPVSAPGQAMLKVAGILLIIGGAASALLGLLGLAGGALLGAVGNEIAGDVGAAAGIFVVLISLMVLVSGGFSLVVGIIGVKNAGNLEKAQLCFTLGIVLIILQGISLVISLIGGDFSPTSAIGLVLPIVYLLGANKNKQAAMSPPQ